MNNETIIKELGDRIVCLHDGKEYPFASNNDRLRSVTFSEQFDKLSSEQFDKLSSEELVTEIKKGMTVNTIIIKDEIAYFKLFH